MKFLYLLSIASLLAAACNPGSSTSDVQPNIIAEAVEQKVNIIEDLKVSPDGKSINPIIDAPPTSDALINAEIGELVMSIRYYMHSMGIAAIEERIPKDTIWMMGTREATQIIFQDDVIIADQKVPNGRYGLFAVPGEKEWTIVLSKKWNMQYANEYELEADQLRFKVAAQEERQHIEYLHFDILPNGANTAKVIFEWSTLRISFDVKKAE